MFAVKTENLSHIYSKGTPFEKAAIRDINIEIEQGEMVGLIGHTGSGKSTLIQHFNGLLKPTDGKIYIDGEDMWADKSDIRQFRFKVGLVFQYPEYQLFEETVYKDIAYGPTNMGLSESEIDRRVRQSAEAVGIDEALLAKSPFELSGGQKRRVAIAGVIAMEPSVLILDEPTAGLDPAGREQIFKLIKDYHKNKGNTVIIVSHSMEDIANHTEKVLVMNESKVFTYGEVSEVFKKSAEIEEMGLAVPQITRVMQMLKNRGLDVKTNIFSVEQAKAEILSAINKR